MLYHIYTRSVDGDAWLGCQYGESKALAWVAELRRQFPGAMFYCVENSKVTRSLHESALW